MPVLAGIAAGIGEAVEGGASDFEDKKRTIVSDFAEFVRLNPHVGEAELTAQADVLSMGNADLRSYLPGVEDMRKIAARNKKVRDDQDYQINKRTSDARRTDLDKHFTQIIGQRALGSDPFPDDPALTKTLTGAREKWLKDKALDADEQHWLRPLDDTAGGLYAWVQGQTYDLKETKKTAARKAWTQLRPGNLSDPTMTPERYAKIQSQFKESQGFGAILDKEFWGSTMYNAASVEAELSRRKELQDLQRSTALAQETSAQRALDKEINAEFEKRIGRGEKQDAAIADTLSALGITKQEDIDEETAKLKKLDITAVEASRLRALWAKYESEVLRAQTLGNRPISAEEIQTLTGIPISAKLNKMMVLRGKEDFDATHQKSLNEAEPALRDAMAKGKPMSWWLSTTQNEEDKWDSFLTYLQQVNHPDFEKIKKENNKDYMWKKINQALHQAYDFSESESWEKRRTDHAQHIQDLKGTFSGDDYNNLVKSTLTLDKTWPTEGIQDLGKGWSEDSFLTAVRSGVLNLFTEGDNNYVYSASSAPGFVSAIVQSAIQNAKLLTDGKDPSDPATIEAWIRSNAPSIISTHAYENRISPLDTQRDWITQQADIKTSASAGPAYITEENFMKESDARVTQAENLVAVMREHLQTRNSQEGVMDTAPFTEQMFMEQYGPDAKKAAFMILDSIEFLTNQAQMYERNPARMRHTDARNRADLRANVEKLVALKNELVSGMDFRFTEVEEEKGPDTSNLDPKVYQPWLALGVPENMGEWIKVEDGSGKALGKFIGMPEGNYIWKGDWFNTPHQDMKKGIQSRKIGT